MWFGVPLPLVTALCRVESLLLGLEVLLRDRGIRSHDWRRGTRGRARHKGHGDTVKSEGIYRSYFWPRCARLRPAAAFISTSFRTRLTHLAINAPPGAAS